MVKASRDHLVPKQIVNRNGKNQTVHVRPPEGGKLSARSRVLAAPPSTSIATADSSDDVDVNDREDAPEEIEAPKGPILRFEPNVEWGNDHLNRRNLRIIKSIDEFDDETYSKMLYVVSEDSDDADAEDYERALAQTFKKWDQVNEIGDSPSIDVPEEAYRSSRIRRGLLTDLADNPRVCRGIATEINSRKDNPDVSDVEPVDVHLALELMRDATSDETLAMQTRAYALRVHRDNLQQQISELSQKVEAAEAPLRSLVQNAGSTYTFTLGDEGFASVTFIPRTVLNTDRALAELSEEEKKRITVESYEWKRLEQVIGKARADSYREPGVTAVSIK